MPNQPIEAIDENGLNALTGKLKTYINNNANVPMEVMTESKMNAILADGANNLGKVFIYKGTTGTYKNGDIYIVEEGV